MIQLEKRYVGCYALGSRLGSTYYQLDGAGNGIVLGGLGVFMIISSHTVFSTCKV
jgi:hypothetical protein